MSNAVTSTQQHGTNTPTDQVEFSRVLKTGAGKRFQVQWDVDAKVTPIGSMVYFAQYLQTAGLMDRLCQGSPLAYTGNNAPDERNVWGTIVLSILNGQTRYAHINTLRGDRVSSEVMGITKVVSEDSVRRALKRGTADAWDRWLRELERSVYEPLLTEAYVLDIDNTVKPLYGHQEGAELGYNPKKPGRPCHNYHTYFVGALRVVLGVEVLPGKEHAGKHGLPGLWRIIDGLAKGCRPRLIRGDVALGNEAIMVQAEEREQRYLFKLRRTRGIREQIHRLGCEAGAWCDAGDGWEGAEQSVRLMGWSRSRRCILLRRRAQSRTEREGACGVREAQFDFVEDVDSGGSYEYMVLVTNDSLPIVGMAQLYRDRAECENVFDEIKNQWGWAGYVTRDLERCRIMARLIALVYNWWNIFTRLACTDRHMEAITSRPMLLHAVGRLVRRGRRKIIRLTSTHAMAEQIRCILNRIATFLIRLARTAEQLNVEARWALILSAAFVKWLRGKVLQPVAEGGQLLLQAPG